MFIPHYHYQKRVKGKQPGRVFFFLSSCASLLDGELLDVARDFSRLLACWCKLESEREGGKVKGIQGASPGPVFEGLR
jgi:hypothetical protein